MIEWDDEYCYGYAYLEDDTGLDRKVLKKEIAELRSLGLVGI